MNRLLERAFLVCGIFLTLDLAFFGPGLLIPGIGIEARRLLLIMLLVAAVVRRMQTPRPLSGSDMALVSWIAVLLLVWAIALPASYGYARAQSLADAEPWTALVVLAVWPWSAWPYPGQWTAFRRFLLVICAILAILHVFIWALLTAGVISPAMLAFTARLVSARGGNAEGFIRVALVGGSYRVYWSSSIFLLGGLYFLAMYRPQSRHLGWYAQVLLIAFALWTTHIRAFLGAIAIFICLKFVLKQTLWMRNVSRPQMRVLALWMAGVAVVAIAMNPVVLHALQLSRSVSDVERVVQARALLGRFENSPMFGTGFGSYAAQYVRTEGAPYSYELVFEALLMKLGLGGAIVLLCCLYSTLRVSTSGGICECNSGRMETWAAFTTGFWFSGATNPMVTNFAGMAVMVLLLVDMHQWSSSCELAVRTEDTHASGGGFAGPVR